MAVRKGPYEIEESNQAIKLEGPTLRIKAGDGSTVLVASTNAGGRSSRGEVEAIVDTAVEALNKAGKSNKK